MIQKNKIYLCFAFYFLISTWGICETCIISDCHKNFNTIKQIHPPVEDDCTSCHQKVGKHTFRIQVGEKLCYQCHDENKEGKHVNEDLSFFKCQDCHDPHGGSDRFFLKNSKVDNLCFECHDQDPMKKKKIHEPLISGNCNLCHRFHSSDNLSLLISAKTTLCFKCHADKDFSAKKGQIHSPLEEGCDGCHNSHSSDYRYLLITSFDNLCRECHDDLIDKSNNFKFKHLILEKGKKCLNCHDPHGSVYKNNLNQEPLSLCLKCHDRPIIGTDGKDYNINKIVTQNPYKHGPVSEGDCTACHDPHGSDFFAILKKSYPQKFYSPFEEKNYSLCFDCHDQSMIKQEKTTTLTDFRDGNRNLHYLHVNKKKGRTCRVCHEVHASKFPKHIREDVPFGRWSIPIKFEKRTDGGTCAPGCHKAYTYSRDKKELKK